jgi:hypothetical protein
VFCGGIFEKFERDTGLRPVRGALNLFEDRPCARLRAAERGPEARVTGNVFPMDRFAHCARRASGFTFVELCIGLVVVSLVMGALAAFSLATAEAWQQGATTNAVGNGQNVAAIPLIGTVACARLDNEISSALQTGGYFTGNLTSPTGQQASLLLWKSDPNSDRVIDAGEVELIEYNATDHIIYKYVPTITSPAATGYTTFSNSSWIATFKPTATMTPLARNVDGMQIYVQTPNSATQLPVVEYRLYFSRGGHAQTRYGAIALRSPETANQQVPN